jgi:hypothetical protein
LSQIVGCTAAVRRGRGIENPVKRKSGSTIMDFKREAKRPLNYKTESFMNWFRSTWGRDLNRRGGSCKSRCETFFCLTLQSPAC